jgi:hypothetical protein
MQVENRKLDLTKQHVISFGTIIQIHMPKQPNNSYPRGELDIILGPSECTYNAMDCSAIYSQKIVVRHQYTVFTHILKEFPWKLHNQPTTPAALIKKMHALEKTGRVIIQKEGEEPEHLNQTEGQELLDSITSDKDLPLPPPATYIEPPTPITMRVPIQTTTTTDIIQDNPKPTSPTTTATTNPAPTSDPIVKDNTQTITEAVATSVDTILHTQPQHNILSAAQEKSAQNESPSSDDEDDQPETIAQAESSPCKKRKLHLMKQTQQPQQHQGQGIPQNPRKLSVSDEAPVKCKQAIRMAPEEWPRCSLPHTK